MSAKESKEIVKSILKRCQDHIGDASDSEKKMDIVVAISYVFTHVCKTFQIDPVQFAKESSEDFENFHDNDLELNIGNARVISFPKTQKVIN